MLCTNGLYTHTLIQPLLRSTSDEESDVRSKPSQTSKEGVVFDSKHTVRAHRTSRKTSIVDKTCGEDGGESIQSSSLNNSRGGREGEPRFAEEDYIVFCFREDGAIHMIEEGKSSEAYDENAEHENTTTADVQPAATLRPINRKVIFSKKTSFVCMFFYQLFLHWKSFCLSHFLVGFFSWRSSFIMVNLLGFLGIQEEEE